MDQIDQEFTSGVIPDPRSEEERSKDYKHEEVAMAVPLNWARDKSGAPVYSNRDQDGSGSCYGQAASKAFEILEGQVISAHPIYRRRTNFPDQGMWGPDVGRICTKKNCGTTTEILDPSQRQGEEEMNRDVVVATPIVQAGYFMLTDPTDMDALANAIETRKHCVISISGPLEFYAKYEKPIPKPYPEFPRNFGHALCLVYYFTDENGEKCVIADESWGPNNIRRRILTATYIKWHITSAMYFIHETPPPPAKPKHTFTKVLYFGMENEPDVVALQDILKYEGFFPAAGNSTGNYYEITRKAVLKFQRKYAVAPESELVSLQGRRVGKKTMAKLNELYG